MEDSWFGRFVKLLTENCRLGDLEQRLQSVALIVFNYDRCIEHYLQFAIANYYAIEPREAAALLSLEIYYPYGTDGRLSVPGQPTADAVDFGLAATVARC